eukprot:104122_1
MNAYDVLETHSRDNDFCRLILNFMVNHPLEKYTKIRFLNIEDALKELNNIAKELTNLAKLLEDNKSKFVSVLTIFMIHVSCLFARNMVEILIYLSFNIEPHIYFWENQYKLNNKNNKYKLYKYLTKIYTLSISLRRARIFKKLLSDLYIQIGRIQWWFWGLIKLKNSFDSNFNSSSIENILQFINEMNDLFINDINDINDINNINNINDNDNKLKNKNVIASMIETISFADSFAIKMQKDINIWGMPSHWRKNYKIYSFYTITIMFTSILSYYNWTNIKNITNNIANNIRNSSSNIWINIKELLYKSDDNLSCNTELKNNLQEEKQLLLDMISLYDYNIQQYKNDIKTPLHSAIKGSLLANIFVQIQKVKVEISKLLIDTNNIIDSNKVNMEIFAVIPFIGLLYLFQHVLSNSNYEQNKLKKKRSEE